MADLDILGLPPGLPTPNDVIEGQRAAGGNGSSFRFAMSDLVHTNFRYVNALDRGVLMNTPNQHTAIQAVFDWAYANDRIVYFPSSPASGGSPGANSYILGGRVYPKTPFFGDFGDGSRKTRTVFQNGLTFGPGDGINDGGAMFEVSVANGGSHLQQGFFAYGVAFNGRAKSARGLWLRGSNNGTSWLNFISLARLEAIYAEYCLAGIQSEGFINEIVNCGGWSCHETILRVLVANATRIQGGYYEYAPVPYDYFQELGTTPAGMPAGWANGSWGIQSYPAHGYSTVEGHAALTLDTVCVESNGPCNGIDIAEGCKSIVLLNTYTEFPTAGLLPGDTNKYYSLRVGTKNVQGLDRSGVWSADYADTTGAARVTIIGGSFSSNREGDDYSRRYSAAGILFDNCQVHVVGNPAIHCPVETTPNCVGITGDLQGHDNWGYVPGGNATGNPFFAVPNGTISDRKAKHGRPTTNIVLNPTFSGGLRGFGSLTKNGGALVTENTDPAYCFGDAKSSLCVEMPAGVGVTASWSSINASPSCNAYFEVPIPDHMSAAGYFAGKTVAYSCWVYVPHGAVGQPNENFGRWAGSASYRALPVVQLYTDVWDGSAWLTDKGTGGNTGWFYERPLPAITSITRSGTTLTVVFASDHKMALGDIFRMPVCSEELYRGQLQVASVSGLQVTATLAVASGATSANAPSSWNGQLISNYRAGTWNLMQGYVNVPAGRNLRSLRIMVHPYSSGYSTNQPHRIYLSHLCVSVNPRALSDLPSGDYVPDTTRGRLEGGILYTYGTAPPTNINSTYKRGDTVVNTRPTPGSYRSWVCLSSNTPGVDAGTWSGCDKIVDPVPALHYDFSEPTLSSSTKHGPVPVFTRSGPAWMRDKTGRLVKVTASNSPRLAHFPGNMSSYINGQAHTSSTSAGGILLETSARTNIVPNVHAATWTPLTNTSVTHSVATGPDLGGLTAHRISMVGTATAQYLANFTGGLTEPNFTNANGGVHTFSVFLKSDGWLYATLGTKNKSNDSYPAVSVELTTGAILSVSNTGAFVAAGTESYTNGWVRVWLCMAVGSGATVPDIQVFLCGLNGNSTVTGVNGSSILVWGPQIENGYGMSSFIETTAGAVTRNAEMLVVDDSDLPISGKSGTLIYRGLPNFNNPSSASWLYQLLSYDDSEDLLAVRHRNHTLEPVIGTTVTAFGTAVTAQREVHAAFTYSAEDALIRMASSHDAAAGIGGSVTDYDGYLGDNGGTLSFYGARGVIQEFKYLACLQADDQLVEAVS